MCVYSRTCAWLWRRSLFPCCVPGIEAAHDLQVNKPETRGATKHTHVHQLPHMPSHGLMLSRRFPLFFSLLHRLALSPSQISTPHLPYPPALSPPLTHTLTAPPTAHSTPLIKGFCFFNFPFLMQGPCTAVAAALAAREVCLPVREEKTLKCLSVKYLLLFTFLNTITSFV